MMMMIKKPHFASVFHVVLQQRILDLLVSCYTPVFFKQKTAADSVAALILSKTDSLADMSDTVWRHIVLPPSDIDIQRSLDASRIFSSPLS